MTKGKMKKTPLHIFFQGFWCLKNKPPPKQFMKDNGGTGRKKETRKTLNLVFGCTWTLSTLMFLSIYWYTNLDSKRVLSMLSSILTPGQQNWRFLFIHLVSLNGENICLQRQGKNYLSLSITITWQHAFRNNWTLWIGDQTTLKTFFTNWALRGVQSTVCVWDEYIWDTPQRARLEPESFINIAF